MNFQTFFFIIALSYISYILLLASSHLADYFDKIILERKDISIFIKITALINACFLILITVWCFITIVPLIMGQIQCWQSNKSLKQLEQDLKLEQLKKCKYCKSDPYERNPFEGIPSLECVYEKMLYEDSFYEDSLYEEKISNDSFSRHIHNSDINSNNNLKIKPYKICCVVLGVCLVFSFLLSQSNIQQMKTINAKQMEQITVLEKKLSDADWFLNYRVAVVTPTGKKYHKYNCTYAKGVDQLKIYFVPQAQDLGYEPCSICY